MLGAIIGDMVGRPYEFTGKKDYNFPFFNRYCTTTDDSYMTVAVGRALQNCIDNLDDIEALKNQCLNEIVTETIDDPSGPGYCFIEETMIFHERK